MTEDRPVGDERARSWAERHRHVSLVHRDRLRACQLWVGRWICGLQGDAEVMEAVKPPTRTRCRTLCGLVLFIGRFADIFVFLYSLLFLSTAWLTRRPLFAGRLRTG
jgi:hypothetical protein